jgi:hypothetical protein
MEVLKYTTANPTMDVTIYIDTFRQGADIQVVANAVCSFRYTDGVLGTGYYAYFNVWTPDTTGSATGEIKSSSETWRASAEMSRTTTVSYSINSQANNIRVYFNITGAPGQVSLVTPQDEYNILLDAPAFTAPSAPTWVNVTPNPCGIDGRPLITWGGAAAGSTGILLYDIEVQSSKSSGGWTDWVRLGNAQSPASYQDTIIRNKNIGGQTPYIGVQYKYRIRSSDGQYSNSSWIYSSILNVSFGSPTAPTSYRLSSTRIKKGNPVTVSWSGGSGGTGTISGYYLEVRTYNHITATWSGWSQIYAGVSTSYTYSNASLKNNDLIQFRVRLRNSWGQYTSYLTTSNVTIKSNQMWIKINGTWREGEVYIKINGTWRSGAPYIKINGTWRESI